MDRVTQDNAAQTEELSSTSESLAAQAEEMLTVVSRFTLPDGVGDGPGQSDSGSPQRLRVTEGQRRRMRAELDGQTVVQSDDAVLLFEPGRYPVTLSRARIGSPADPEIPAGLSLVAAARLTIRDEPVTRWELALRPGQDPARLQPGGFWGFYGFGVDSGAGAFLDLSALAELRLDRPVVRGGRAVAVAGRVLGADLEPVFADCEAGVMLG